MKKLALIVVYFGKLPEWFHLFQLSLKYNSDIDLFLFTDNDTQSCDNLIVHKTAFAEMKAHIQSKFDFPVRLDSPYKLCDYKPAYGYIFQEYIKDYEFWGHCDIDMILGDVLKKLTDDILNGHDKFYKHGHLGIYRNTEENNLRFTSDKGMNYKSVFSSRSIKVFDEYEMQKKFELMGVNTYVSDDFADITAWHENFRRAVPDEGVVESNFNYERQVFFWENGKVLRAGISGANEIVYDEFIYIHFQKRKLQVHFDDSTPSAYYITKKGFYKKEEGQTVPPEIIELYNGLDKKAEKKTRRARKVFVFKRRLKKYLFRR